MGEDRNRASSFSRLSRLLELDVVDADGEAIGRVDDLLLDPRGGRIRYVRLMLDLPRGARSRHVLTIPWSAVRIESGASGRRWRVAARRPTLERLSQTAPLLPQHRGNRD